MSSGNALARLANEAKRMKETPPLYTSAGPRDPNNLFLWDCIVIGPSNSPYQNGTFTVELKFPPDYPQNPPTARFRSRMFHPNVYPDGEICVDILHNYNWKPQYDAFQLVTSILSLLIEPNVNDPANLKAANMYSNNYSQFKQECFQVAYDSWND